MQKWLAWAIPLGLGVVAGFIYLTSVRAGTRPIELVGVSQNMKAGDDLTEDRLTRVSVRADKTLLRSAIRWEDRGLLVGRRVNRALVEGELLLFTDVRQSVGDVSANLKPDEASRTAAVPQFRVVPGLRVGDSVVFLVAGDVAENDPAPDSKGRRSSGGELGPFRVVGLSERTESTNPADQRLVVVAVKKDGTGTPAERAARETLDAALAGARGLRIQAVEVPGGR